MYVTGSFNHWGERIPLRRSGADHVVCLNLLAGTYQYKFIVDNEWRYAADQPTVRDEMGNINNCLTVEDQTAFMQEDPASGFFGNNPANFYTQALPDEITLAKEPPSVPAHLGVLSLNQSALPEPRIASWTLREPLLVTLTHICSLRNASSRTLSCTHRFRNKFVTIVMYKPEHSATLDSWQQQAAQQQAAQQQAAQQQAVQQQQQAAAQQQQQQAVAQQQQLAAADWQQQQQLLYYQHLQQQQQQPQQAGAVPPPLPPGWGGMLVPPPGHDGSMGPPPPPMQPLPPHLQQPPPPTEFQQQQQARVSWSDAIMAGSDGMMPPPTLPAQHPGAIAAPKPAHQPGPSSMGPPPRAPVPGAAPPPLFKLPPTPGGCGGLPPPMGDGLGGGMMMSGVQQPGGAEMGMGAIGAMPGSMSPPAMVPPGYCQQAAAAAAAAAAGHHTEPQAMEMSSRHSSHTTLMDTSRDVMDTSGGSGGGIPPWAAAVAPAIPTATRQDSRNDVVMR